jgi:hypothetical protein
MANVKSAELSYYDSFAAEMMGKFQRLSQLISHGNSNGSYHEEILRTVLRNFLSKRYSVKTGFIYQDSLHISKQIDILIIDENVPAAYIFQEGDFAVVTPKAVVAVMEVKTTLTPTEFESALRNIASAKQFSEFHVDIAGIIFGYQKDSKPVDSTIGEWFKRPVAQEVGRGGIKAGPDLITFFKDNYSLMRFNPVNNLINDSENYRKFYQEARDGDNARIGWQLSIILSMVMSVCERNEFKKTRIFSSDSQANKLLAAEELSMGDEEFKLGDGLLQSKSKKSGDKKQGKK